MTDINNQEISSIGKGLLFENQSFSLEEFINKKENTLLEDTYLKIFYKYSKYSEQLNKLNDSEIIEKLNKIIEIETRIQDIIAFNELDFENIEHDLISLNGVIFNKSQSSLYVPIISLMKHLLVKIDKNIESYLKVNKLSDIIINYILYCKSVLGLDISIFKVIRQFHSNNLKIDFLKNNYFIVIDKKYNNCFSILEQNSNNFDETQIFKPIFNNIGKLLQKGHPKIREFREDKLLIYENLENHNIEFGDICFYLQQNFINIGGNIITNQTLDIYKKKFDKSYSKNNKGKFISGIRLLYSIIKAGKRVENKVIKFSIFNNTLLNEFILFSNYFKYNGIREIKDVSSETLTKYIELVRNILDILKSNVKLPKKNDYIKIGKYDLENGEYLLIFN